VAGIASDRQWRDRGWRLLFSKLAAAFRGLLGMSEPVRAVVTKRFAATAERVFGAWLDPDWLGRWMFGPNVRDERIVRLGLEPRVGGKFSFIVERGGKPVDHVGEYLELDRPRRLVFTWATRDSLPETSRVIVEITPLDGECELTLTHEMAPAWAAFADQAADSWRKMLDGLAGTLV
jgi:uncharacterized protein YndB with AHSA1/START domain